MHPSQPWQDLPGRIDFSDSDRRDYLQLQRYHYRLRPPATWNRVRVARYIAPGFAGPGRLVACAVLSYPVPMLGARLRMFGLRGHRYGVALRFANKHFMTVSRIVVHPQFRTVGLASELVRQLIDGAPTRFVEASAAMARFSRFLERAGMTRFADPEPADSIARPSYFVFDRFPADPIPSPEPLENP
jgi:GNAT superfamily N-acetyltransferase